MSSHFYYGALNKLTKSYEHPSVATKKNNYICPSCNNDVIFKNGKINKPHFSHYASINPCTYYTHNGESQIHIDAKFLLKSLLDSQKYMTIYNICCCCKKRNNDTKNNAKHFMCIINDYFTDTSCVVVEYKFKFNDTCKIADVALIDNNNITYIFEICNTHKTKDDDRPEPWIEIDAKNLVEKFNLGTLIDKNGIIHIDNIRNFTCDKCIEYEKAENIKKETRKIKIEQDKIHVQKEQDEEQKETLNYNIKKSICKDVLCQCGIYEKYLCHCENPKYILLNINNCLLCNSCNKWKCRCDT
jgi:hypothetical protein